MYFGRAFELADGTIILPCDYCGNPVFVPPEHTCEGLMAAELERMEDME